MLKKFIYGTVLFTAFTSALVLGACGTEEKKENAVSETEKETVVFETEEVITKDQDTLLGSEPGLLDESEGLDSGEALIPEGEALTSDGGGLSLSDVDNVFDSDGLNVFSAATAEAAHPDLGLEDEHISFYEDGEVLIISDEDLSGNKR